MSGIRTHSAAALLGVSPNTLRSWERRYGFPSPQRTAGGHRQYAFPDIEGLRVALAETHNVSSAVALARQRGTGPSSSARVAGALRTFGEEAANRLLEESLALRSVERTLEEVLLPAVAELAEPGHTSPEYAFAWRFATGWISAMKRLAPPASRPEGALLLETSAPLALDALHGQALEVMLRRAGLRTLSLAAAVEPQRVGRAVRALGPSLLILTGRGTGLDAIGRLVFAVRGSAGELPVLDFRGALPDTGASTVTRLGDSALAARDAVVARLARAVPQRRQA